jgi:hypothetical protein
MTDLNAGNINTPKIMNQLDYLKRLRTVGPMSMGWEDGDIPPPVANALVKAGLVRIDVEIFLGKNAKRTVHAVPQGG